LTDLERSGRGAAFRPRQPEPDPQTGPASAGPDVRWLQPIPDALVAPDAEDPAAVVAAREGLRLALIATLQYLPDTQRAVLIRWEALTFPAPEVARDARPVRNHRTDPAAIRAK
jgi:DNA-directed RNA polymerase specialized sigma24 family protein